MPFLLEISMDLPRGITLESLYQINKPSIWFLIWIFKKNRFWPDLTRVVLEKPFTVKRRYWTNGKIFNIYIKKNTKYCSIYRGWYDNGQLEWEHHYKDGISRVWSKNGKLINESYWKDGTKFLEKS